YMPEGSTNHGLEQKTVRFGANLRLMTPGKTVRMVGLLGGGIAWNQVKFDSQVPGGTLDGEGVDPFALGELGIELSFSGVLVGAAGTAIFQSSRGINSGNASDENGVYDRKPIGFLGLGLHVGYAFW